MFGKSKQANELARDAQVLMKYGRFEDAIPVCQRLVEIWPSLVGGWEELGYALLKVQRFDEAVTAYDRALALERPNTQQLGLAAHRNRLHALLRLNRLDDALAAADVILTRAPKDQYAWMCRGLVCAQRKHFDDAEKALLNAVDLKPTDQALWRLTRFYADDLHAYDKALEIIERLLASKPNSGSVWQMKGYVLSQSGKRQEACTAFERAIVCGTLADAEVGNLWNNIGDALLYLGRYQDSLVALDKGAALAPGNAYLFITRGEVFSHIERESEALACYEAALQAEPALLIAQTDIAAALVALGSLDEAKVHLDTVFAVNANYGCAWYVTGMRETVLGHFDDALAACDKAIALEPRHASHYVAFAELLLKLDDPEHACQVIDRALALDPYDARSWRIKAAALRAAGREGEATEIERRSAAMLAEQIAQVDAYLKAQGGS